MSAYAGAWKKIADAHVVQDDAMQRNASSPWQATSLTRDALVYAEHAGRTGKIEIEVVVLAIQARWLGAWWSCYERIHCLFNSSTKAIPLPPVPEIFGVRLPSSPHILTQVDFNFVHNTQPPP